MTLAEVVASVLNNKWKSLSTIRDNVANARGAGNDCLRPTTTGLMIILRRLKKEGLVEFRERQPTKSELKFSDKKILEFRQRK